MTLLLSVPCSRLPVNACACPALPASSGACSATGHAGVPSWLKTIPYVSTCCRATAMALLALRRGSTHHAAQGRHQGAMSSSGWLSTLLGLTAAHEVCT